MMGDIQLKKLAQARILAGRKGLLDLLRHRRQAVEEIIIAQGVNLPGELKSEIDRLGAECPRIVHCDRRLMDQTFPDLNTQGVLAVLRPALEKNLDEMIASAKAPSGKGLLLLLDEISDPHNLGSILRAAEAAGVDGVLITGRHSAQVNPTVRKVSAGASELVPLATVSNLARSINLLKKKGFWVVGTALGGGASSLFEADLPAPLALVLGSEGKGLRKLTKDLCDVLVQIPMDGQIESLNVSQAAAVILFELLRRRMSSANKKGFR